MKFLRPFSLFLLSLTTTFTQIQAQWTTPVDLAGWSAPVDLSAPGQNASIPKVATDPIGNAVAVWGRFNGLNLIIQAASLPFGASWSEPANLSQPGRSATAPQVAVDPNGNAVAIWSRNDGSYSIIQAATQTYGGGWSTPVNLSLPGQNATNPQVIIDQSGNAVAIWERFNGFFSMIQSATLPHNGSWSPPVDISLIGQDAFLPQLAVNLSGNVLAVWKRFNGAHYVIESAALPYGGTWSAPTTLSQPRQNADKPQIALDFKGEALAVWTRFNGKTNVVQASRALFGKGWSNPETLSIPALNSANPQVGIALGGTSNAVVIWEDSIFHTIQSLKMTFGVWGEIQTISPISDFATRPQLAVDFYGNAIAVWQNSSKKLVQSASLNFRGNWSKPEDLSEVGQFATAPQVTIDAKGNAIAVWIRSNGSHNIAQASSGFNLFATETHEEEPTPVEPQLPEPREEEKISEPEPEEEVEEQPEIIVIPSIPTNPTLPPAPTPPSQVQTNSQALLPPSNFKGKMIKQTFLVQKVRVHQLTWKASPDNRVSGYLLVRNGKKIAKISGKGPLVYTDSRRKKRGRDVYQLSAYSKDGLVSTAVTLAL